MNDPVVVSIAEYEQRERARLNGLTPRQCEYLLAAADGMIDAEIAKKVGVAEATVKNMFTAVFQRLGARSRTHAVAIALRQGIIK